VSEVNSIHSPLAGGNSSHYGDTSSIYDDSLFTSLASHYNISVGTVILSWLVQRGIVVIPHSSSPTRLAENRGLVSLAENEVLEINRFHEKAGRNMLIEHAPMGWIDIPGKGRTFMGWTCEEIGWKDSEGNCLI
jgi:glycerol 2-dehydrogenase (NADP+)